MKNFLEDGLAKKKFFFRLLYIHKWYQEANDCCLLDTRLRGQAILLKKAVAFFNKTLGLTKFEDFFCLAELQKIK